MKKLLLLLVIVLNMGIHRPLFADDELRTLLDKISMIALKNNPQLEALYQAMESDSVKTPAAGALPDPVISINLMNLPVDNFVFNQEPMSGKQIAFMQKFPLFGKLKLKEDIAKLSVQSRKFYWQEARNKLAADVRRFYLELFYLEQSLKTIEENQQLLRQLISVSQTRYATGKGAQQDVLKAQVELSKLMRQSIVVTQKKQSMWARLKSQLNYAVDESFGLPREISYDPESFVDQTLKEYMLNKRPLLKLAEIELEKYQKQVSLINKTLLPDITASVAYTQREVLKNGLGGTDYLSGGISLNIPLYFWRKQQPEIQARKIMVRKGLSEEQNIRNRMLFQIEDLLAKLEKNATLIRLYETGILPQARQSLTAAFTGYQTDKIDFLTLLNNQKTLLNLQLEYVQALTDYYKSLSDLAYVTGVEKLKDLPR